MGASISGMAKTYQRKGVTYDTDNGAVIDCLFCRIADEKEVNQLWYKDDDVAIFVPRTPAALIHLLVVPIHHIGTLNNVGPNQERLLRKMRDVALHQLAFHGSRTVRPLTERAPPPLYPYDRGRLGCVDPFSGVSAPYSSASDAMAGAASRPSLSSAYLSSSSSSVPAAHDSELSLNQTFDLSRIHLAFHRPPWNSIDHLHLHALYGPYTSCWDRLTFLPGAPWHAGIEEALMRTGAASGTAAAALGSAPEMFGSGYPKR